LYIDDGKKLIAITSEHILREISIRYL